MPVRLLIQTGRRLEQLTLADLAKFTAACQDRQERTGKGHHHYLSAASNAQRVLFHLEVLDELARGGGPAPFAERLAQVQPPIRATMISYLDRKRATYQPKTVSTIATRLKHFGVFLAATDPDLESVAALERTKHIEPYLSSMVDAVNSKNGETITAADRSRRVRALMGFLTDITQFLFTPHGRRLAQSAVRAELDRAASAAGLEHITPHSFAIPMPPPWSTPESPCKP